MDAQVVDGKRVIKDLRQEDFVVSDEGQIQKTNYFGHDAEAVSLLLLFDVSGSMQRYIDQIAATAREALGFLRPGDKVGIMVFARNSEIHQDFSDNLAESARQIRSAVREHDVGSTTAINSAIVNAAEYIQRQNPKGRRAVLILTDNLSLNYQVDDRKVIRELYAADAVLNAIVVGRGIRPKPPEPGRYTNPDFTPSDVFHIAEETGGEAVRADHPDITFSEMVERIRTRYSLAYHAPTATAGSFRHIQVTLTPVARQHYPHAQVRARSGYYVK